MASEAEQAAHDDAHRLRSAGQDDARALEHQAAHTGQPAKATKATEAKLAKHRDLIVVSLTLVGIIIGYLSFRQAKGSSGDDSSSSDSSGASSGATDDDGDLLDGYTSTAGGSPSGYVIGGGATSAGDTGDGADSSGTDAGDMSDVLSGFQDYLTNQSDELGSIESTLQTINTGIGKIPTSPHLPRPINPPRIKPHPHPTQNSPKKPAKKASDRAKHAGHQVKHTASKARRAVAPKKPAKKPAPRRR